MKKIVELILLNSEDEYRKEYVERYVGNDNYSLWGVPILFDEKSFDHIFFEPQKGNPKTTIFSKRRAKRMHFIKALLDDEMEREVMFEAETENFAVFCLELECVAYFRIRVGQKALQVATFFDFGKEHTKMYEKQKRKCTPITDVQLKAKLI